MSYLLSQYLGQILERLLNVLQNKFWKMTKFTKRDGKEHLYSYDPAQ